MIYLRDAFPIKYSHSSIKYLKVVLMHSVNIFALILMGHNIPVSYVWGTVETETFNGQKLTSHFEMS